MLTGKEIGLELELKIIEIPDLKAKYEQKASSLADLVDMGYFIEVIYDILENYGISYPYYNDYIGKTISEIGIEKANKIYEMFENLMEE